MAIVTRISRKTNQKFYQVRVKDPESGRWHPARGTPSLGLAKQHEQALLDKNRDYREGPSRKFWPAPHVFTLNLVGRVSGVYFVEDTGTGSIKIGWSGDIKSRMRALQSGSAYTIKLLLVLWRGGKEMEELIHKSLAAHRMCGEWFRPHPEVVQFIRQMAALQSPEGKRDDH